MSGVLKARACIYTCHLVFCVQRKCKLNASFDLEAMHDMMLHFQFKLTRSNFGSKLARSARVPHVHLLLISKSFILSSLLCCACVACCGHFLLTSLMIVKEVHLKLNGQRVANIGTGTDTKAQYG